MPTTDRIPGQPVLEVRGLNVFYGASHALQGVDLTLPSGVMSVVGRNGMGKSTTIKVICRLLRPSAGSVAFDGHDMAGLAPHEAARAGLGLVPEGRRCFGPLTVSENLTAAARKGPWDVAAVEAKPDATKTQEQKLASLLDVDTLSGVGRVRDADLRGNGAPALDADTPVGEGFGEAPAVSHLSPSG
ncbi:MAG: ATP-binding cassette domain-containing protein, partial [Actinomycetota bacterium]